MGDRSYRAEITQHGSLKRRKIASPFRSVIFLCEIFLYFCVYTLLWILPSSEAQNNDAVILADIDKHQRTGCQQFSELTDLRGVKVTGH